MLSDPGSTGTPAALIISLAFTLFPMSIIVLPVGPINVIPLFSQSSGNLGFSDRKP
jgi:hypothetical protein